MSYLDSSQSSQLLRTAGKPHPITEHGTTQRSGSSPKPSRIGSENVQGLDQPPRTNRSRELSVSQRGGKRISDPPRTYKSEDLHMEKKGVSRLNKTVEGGFKKAEKLKTDKVAARKNFKAKFDKFLKEFKSVVKNTGKAGKAVGDTAKGVREAVITGNKMRLGGFDSSEAQKALSKIALKGDTTSGVLGDMAKVTSGIGAVTQLIETGADIYLFHGKTEKLKVDHAMVQEFSDTVEELRDAKRELQQLSAPFDQKLRSWQESISDAKELELDSETIGVLEEQRDIVKDKRDEALQDVTARIKQLTDKVNNTAIGSKLAKGDMDKFLDDLGWEGAKLYKSVGDGLKAGVDLARLAVTSGTVAAEGLKAASGTVGAIIGPLTFVINTRDGIKDIEDNRAALKLKHKAGDAIKGKHIKQDDAELLAIAERIRLKQKKQSVDKGLSATKNAFGAVGGLASGFAGAATIAAMATGAAVGVAAIATPVGWALAGAAALAAIGYGCYKLARHLHSQSIKASLQQTIQTLNQQNDKTATLDSLRGGLSSKETKALDRVAGKLVAAFKAQGIDKKPGDLTVGQLQDYAMKKLLARDTGIATSSLYHRFKDEVLEALAPKTAGSITQQDMQRYLDGEDLNHTVNSAASLMAKLGLNLSPQDALLLLNTGSGGESSALKFLGKKLRLI